MYSSLYFCPDTANSPKGKHPQSKCTLHIVICFFCSLQKISKNLYKNILHKICYIRAVIHVNHTKIFLHENFYYENFCMKVKKFQYTPLLSYTIFYKLNYINTCIIFSHIFLYTIVASRHCTILKVASCVNNATCIDAIMYNYVNIFSSVFIMYTKEPDDPQGDKVLSLSDQLISYGIDCTIDHYYANDNIPDWSFWVTKHIEYCVASVHGYVLLVCSEEMFSILEETSGIVNIRIPMVYAHIDRLTLKNILGRNTPKFLPILIDDDKKTCVPPCLQGKSIFRFPYKRLINVINSQSVLDRPEFSSLRSLVATISGQRENPQPDNELGKTVRQFC